MPELVFSDLPRILAENEAIRLEVEKLERTYLQDYHPRGWNKIDGARKYLSHHHILIEAPVDDDSFGGFIRSTNSNKYICFINTYQPSCYQNFSLFHELFHIIFIKELPEDFHLILAGVDKRVAERKADYFASLMLMDEHDLISFFNGPENQSENVFDKIIMCMHVFKAPYKAVLIRLYELKLIGEDILEAYFDKKVNFQDEFQRLGRDQSIIKRSKHINIRQIEQLLQNYPLPEMAQESNLEVLNEVVSYLKEAIEEESS